MSLYEILVNRPCVWILKELYEAEVINRKVYTMRVSDLKKVIRMMDDPDRYIRVLESNGLLHVDSINEDVVISLNQKGKEFFKLFDKLKILVESQVKIIEEKPMANIEYNLTEPEKKALFAVYKITKEAGDELPINALIIEKKQDAVYDKLQKLNLIAKIKNPAGKGITISLTPAGKRIIQQEVSERLR